MVIGRNPLNPFSRRKLEPQIYEVTCTKCDFAETVELKNKNISCIVNQELEQTEHNRLVKELPKSCPKCAAPVKCKQVRTFWRH